MKKKAYNVWQLIGIIILFIGLTGYFFSQGIVWLGMIGVVATIILLVSLFSVIIIPEKFQP
jgi:hypothetical protein